MKVSVAAALKRVADYPTLPEDTSLLELPTHELVARALFDIANNPSTEVLGSLARATRARKILLDRMVGKRRPGSRPLDHQVTGLTFVDLTAGALDEH